MEGLESTNQTRESQADAMMNRFLRTLQEISLTIQKQGEENASMRQDSEQVLRGLGSAMENLVTKSSESSNTTNSSNANKVDLVEFTGADRSLWPTWQIQARGKAKSCGNNPEVQFYAIFNKLKDSAAKNVTPWVSQNIAMGNATYEGLLNELGRLYDDPAAQAKALSNLKTMKQQERESFANFFPKFEKELANAGGASFEDSIKVMFLRTSLSTRYRSCLPLTKHYATYEELVIDLQTAAAAIANEEILSGRRHAGPVQPRLPEPPVQSFAPTPMDWTPTSNSQGRLNSQPSQRPRARFVSKEVLKARLEANCCLRCGNSNHYQPNCPYRPPINPNRAVSNNRGTVGNIDRAALKAELDISNLEDMDSVDDGSSENV